MTKINKISIRFFDDREVRAIWDDENSKWWFSVLDIVGVLNAQDDYTKNRNYWKYLKNKLKKENNEVIEEENILERLQKLEKAVNEIIDVLNGVTKE